jgi:hypothetical protein
MSVVADAQWFGANTEVCFKPSIACSSTIQAFKAIQHAVSTTTAAMC